MDLFSFTSQLINIPSVTGSEGDVARFLSSFLRELGYRVEEQPVENDRFNVIATTNAPPRIVFSTHMDTVPPFISESEDDEYIFGRGACDAKGIIAAQIFAAERLRSAGMDQLGLLFTVDEELASSGAQAANNHPLAQECRYLINGEPTDNLLAVGTKGSMRLMITATGKSAHSAYPEAGESAIEKLLDVLQSVRTLDWPHDEFLGATTCNIGVISGGTRPNVIPDKAQAELQIRLAVDINQVKELLDGAIGGRAQVEYYSAHNPVKLLRSAGFAETVVRFTTDIPYLSRWGQPLLLGPGSILTAHTERERISKRELKEAVDLYVRLVEQLWTELEKAQESPK
ncbi:MAG TPA: M20/M25/M40 family metallo-hydrolase [Pyrinomonadaceae bacterium]|nr:M20/M25/M40 family metallo-hydrolase [Pyrinomonadaceae bacterium]